MNAQQAENLRILIRHMEAKCDRTLYMDRYFNGCGTPACALGEAAMIFAPATSTEVRRQWCTAAHMDGVILGYTNSNRLFGPSAFNVWGKADVSPQEWAGEARKVLAESGYSMEHPMPAKAADDGFSAFLAKVREPVELAEQL